MNYQTEASPFIIWIIADLVLQNDQWTLEWTDTGTIIVGAYSSDDIDIVLNSNEVLLHRDQDTTAAPLLNYFFESLPTLSY